MQQDHADSTAFLSPMQPAGRKQVEESCLVTIFGPDLGRRFALDRELVTLGRTDESEIVVPLAEVSRCHCRISRTRGMFVITDLGSTNGTYLNDEPLAPERDVILRGGDLIRIGRAVYKFLNGCNVETNYHDALYQAVIRDPLTDAHSRRYLMELLDREVSRCSHSKRPLALAMFDVDGFKGINDERGHAAGDRVLTEIARLATETLGSDDCLARYGGDEFVVVMPDRDLDAAHAFAETLRLKVNAQEFEFGGVTCAVSLSLGVVEHGGDESFDAFLRRADERLYAAKRAGRDCVAS